MGTRADFYIESKGTLAWQGSIAWDGHPDSIEFSVLWAKTQTEFRKELKQWFAKRDDATMPKDGWPWPWENSNTTDYSYVFSKGKVLVSNYGSNLVNALDLIKLERKVKTLESARDLLKDDPHCTQTIGERLLGLGDEIKLLDARGSKPQFPEMSTDGFVKTGKRSGLITVHANGTLE